MLKSLLVEIRSTLSKANHGSAGRRTWPTMHLRLPVFPAVTHWVASHGVPAATEEMLAVTSGLLSIAASRGPLAALFVVRWAYLKGVLSKREM